jgi:serine/threonine-protein kinase HipA
MERVAETLGTFTTFPLLEKLKLFKRTLFSFLIGNEDMHLKNFSIILRDEKIELSPAYVNSNLVLAAPKEELALPIRGRKRKLTQDDLIQYYGIERLGIPRSVCDPVTEEFRSCMPEWEALIAKSFLSNERKIKYLSIVQERAQRLGIFST